MIGWHEPVGTPVLPRRETARLRPAVVVALAVRLLARRWEAMAGAET